MLYSNPSISYNFCGSIVPTYDQLASGDTSAQMLMNASRHLDNQRGLKDEEAYNAHYEGAVGEIAFALLSNSTYTHRVNKFKTHDFILPNGKRIDVKACLFSSIYVSTRHAEDKTMNFVFMKRFGDTVKCLGYISCRELVKHPEWLCNPENRKNKDGSPAWCYKIPPSSLLPVNFPKKEKSNETKP